MELRRQELVLIKWLKLTKGINSRKKAVKHDLGIIGSSSGHWNNNWKVSLKSTEICKSSYTDKDILLKKCQRAITLVKIIRA